MGLNPQNNGDVIIINVPALTEERRRDLLKQAKAVGEHAKVGIRNSRKEANSEIKNLQKEGLPEDNSKDAEAEIEKLQSFDDQDFEKINVTLGYIGSLKITDKDLMEHVLGVALAQVYGLRAGLCKFGTRGENRYRGAKAAQEYGYLHTC